MRGGILDTEIAIRLLTTLATIAATFIGFIIVAVVYYIDKFLKIYGSTKYMGKDKYEIEKRTNIFYWFVFALIIILAPLLIIGLLTIAYSIDTMAMMTSSIALLTSEIEIRITTVRFLFGWLLFAVVTDVMVILISGFLFGVFAERYEDAGEMKDFELECRESRQGDIPEYLAWKSANLGRNLTDEEREDYIKRIEVGNLYKENGQEDEILKEFNNFYSEMILGRPPKQ